MIYQGEFCDINGNEYILEIITKNGASSSVTKLTLQWMQVLTLYTPPLKA
jgi:hypothetical protein